MCRVSGVCAVLRDSTDSTCLTKRLRGAESVGTFSPGTSENDMDGSGRGERSEVVGTNGGLSWPTTGVSGKEAREDAMGEAALDRIGVPGILAAGV